MIRLAAVALIALAAAGCGARLMRLPAGPGAPASDIQQVVNEAASKCRSVSSLTAEAGVSGSAGGRRLRARLLVGLQAPASARLEAVGPFARALFVLVARGDEATLVLNQDNRVLENGRPDAVLEALTGVPLDAAGLRDALTGCPSPGSLAGEGRQLGDEWRSVQDGSSTAYLQREAPAAPWRLVATVHRPSGRPEWRAEYRDYADDLPRAIHFVSSERDRFDLRLTLADVELNAPLGPEAFVVKVPGSADPITLEELRQAGPLGDRR